MTLNGRNAPLAYYFTIYTAFLQAAVYGKRERRQTHTISDKKECLMSTGLPFSDVKNVHEFTEVMAQSTLKNTSTAETFKPITTTQ